MKYLMTSLIIPFFLMGSVACAEEAKSPVKPKDPIGQGEECPADEPNCEEEALELAAVTYEGTDPFGKACHLYVSVLEEEHEGEHHHELVAKMGYQLHGEKPIDTVVEFQRYNLNENKYYSPDEGGPDSLPVLVSAILDHDDEEVDYNKLLEYEEEGHLVQSLRADFKEMSMEAFEESIEEVISDKTKFEDHKAELDQLDRLVLKLAHGGHYDAVACLGFRATGVNKVTFEIGGDHDHDDDHDHGDDDDDDDDHDDHGDPNPMVTKIFK